MIIKFYTLNDDQDNPFYVGKTKKELKTRLKEHIRGAYKSKNAKSYKIRSLLKNNINPTITEISSISVDEFNTLEDMLKFSVYEENLWIQLFKCWGFKIKNHIIDNNFNSYIGSISNKLSKKVYMYNKDGMFIREFKSSQEVIDLQIVKSKGNLNSVLNGKRKICNGYKFSYNKTNILQNTDTIKETLKLNVFKNDEFIGCLSFEDINNLLNISKSNVYRYLRGERTNNIGYTFKLQNGSDYNKLNINRGIAVLQLDLDGNLIKVYKNLTETSKTLKVSKTAILNSIKKGYSCLGYKFEYDL